MACITWKEQMWADVSRYREVLDAVLTLTRRAQPYEYPDMVITPSPDDVVCPQDAKAVEAALRSRWAFDPAALVGLKDATVAKWALRLTPDAETGTLRHLPRTTSTSTSTSTVYPLVLGPLSPAEGDCALRLRAATALVLWAHRAALAAGVEWEWLTGDEAFDRDTWAAAAELVRALLPDLALPPDAELPPLAAAAGREPATRRVPSVPAHKAHKAHTPAPSAASSSSDEPGAMQEDEAASAGAPGKRASKRRRVH